MRVPGGGFLHPVPLVAVALLVLNDHVLKQRWPSWWTGKLSDVAGLIFFPLLLQGLWEVLHAARGRSVLASRRVLVLAVVLTGLCFSAIQVWPLAAEAWRWGLGALQWPGRALGTWVHGAGVPGVVPVTHTADVGDLLALPALGVALRVGWRRCGVEPLE